MSAKTDVHDLKAAVLFSTRFGTTEKVARAFESGLRQTGLQTVCANTQGFPPESLKEYDLICVGGPTEVLSATKPVKEFLKSTERVDLGGKFAFAFDTKLESHISGSAAKYIEHSLDDQGLHLVAHRESAIVTTEKEGGKIVGALLKDGEEQRFRQLGQTVGTKAVEDMAAVAKP